MLLFNTNANKTINELKDELNKLQYELNKKDLEVDLLSFKIESIKSLKKENQLLKGQNYLLELKLTSLQEHYNYFSDCINNSPCQLVRDTFSRNNIELPILDSEEVLKASRFF